MIKKLIISYNFIFSIVYVSYYITSIRWSIINCSFKFWVRKIFYIPIFFWNIKKTIKKYNWKFYRNNCFMFLIKRKITIKLFHIPFFLFSFIDSIQRYCLEIFSIAITCNYSWSKTSIANYIRRFFT